MVFAAVPPDVPKVSDLPTRAIHPRGSAPKSREAQPLQIKNKRIGKAEPFRTSGGKAAPLGAFKL
jgi:hypothetical protein